MQNRRLRLTPIRFLGRRDPRVSAFRFPLSAFPPRFLGWQGVMDDLRGASPPSRPPAPDRRAPGTSIVPLGSWLEEAPYAIAIKIVRCPPRGLLHPDLTPSGQLFQAQGTRHEP